MSTITLEQAPYQLSDQIDPADVCGGVYDYAKERFVPVAISDVYHDPEFGHTLWEYTTDEGEARASLLFVPAGQTSPIWHIAANAGDDNQGYVEQHKHVAGPATLVRQTPVSMRETTLATDPELDLFRTEAIDMQDTLAWLPVLVEPGDSFRLESPADPENRHGGMVLAVFTKAPFILEYEERVEAFVA